MHSLIAMADLKGGALVKYVMWIWRAVRLAIHIYTELGDSECHCDCGCPLCANSE